MKKKVLILALVLALMPREALSTVSLMQLFNNDKNAKASMKNKCNVCHTSSTGGGPRNAFGQAFESAGKKFTDELKGQFPNLFQAVTAAAPKISRLKPSKAKAGVETKIMIMGSGFASDSIVKVDGTDFSGAVFVSSKKIEITVTFDSAGVHTVQVVNASGQTSKAAKVKVK